MSDKRADASGLVIGGEPRIDFLPPEIKARKQARSTIRSMLALVLVVVVACVGGYAFSTVLAVQAQAALADEQARTQQLIQEQGQYAEARAVANQVAATKDARLLGLANEVLWQQFLSQLASTLPSGSVLTSVAIDSIGAFESPAITAVPLQGSGVATITTRALTPSLPAISQWLENLREMPGFAGAWATPAQHEDGGYSVAVTLTINSDVFEKRFFEAYEGRDAPEEAVEPADEAEASVGDGVDDGAADSAPEDGADSEADADDSDADGSGDEATGGEG